MSAEDDERWRARRRPFEVPPDLLETIEEQAERAAREAERERRRARGKRLCGLAVLALDVLRSGDPRLRVAVEAAIHDVGDGVLALATFEAAVRSYQTPTPEERRRAGSVIENTALGWALENVEKLVRAHEAEKKR